MTKGELISNDNKNVEYMIFGSDKVENVNPFDYFQEKIITSSFGLTHLYLKKYIEFYKISISEESIIKFSMKESIKSWDKLCLEIEQTEIPKELFQIFNSSSKKQQVNALKNSKINSNILMALIFKAWEDHNYSFSRYVSKHYPKDTEKNKLPKIAHLDKNKIEKIGKTDLTDGQLKQVIENRKVIVSNFFDNNKNWFCLFFTFDSLKGKEGWKNGTPHYHFISDKFGLSKEKVIKQLTSREYKLGNLPHIEMERIN